MPFYLYRSRCRSVDVAYGSDEGGNLYCLLPQGKIVRSLPMPNLSSQWRVNCKALIPSGKRFTRRSCANLNSEQAT